MSTVPVDFPGMILPQTNPPTPPPHLDTDAPSDIATPVVATGHIENAPLPRITKSPTGQESIQNAAIGHPERAPITHSRTVQYPTGHIVAFSDHLTPEEFDKAAKVAWQKIKEQ
jgi:hypothetical protein